MRFRCSTVLLAAVVAVFAGPASSSAQNYRMRGISPIFDGWEELPDGTRLFYFGYINRSDLEVTVPLGRENSFEPSPSDRGQPTNFLPGRHEHVFTVKAPPNFQGKLVWTLQTEAGVQVANASFDQLYILEERENEDPNARPPEIKLTDVVARVSETVRLAPEVRAGSGRRAVVEGAAAEAAGLSVTWNKHRGTGSVTFAAVPGAPTRAPAGRGGRGGRQEEARPGTFPVLCTAQAGAGCGAVTARFSEPGVYILRAAARQDGLQGLIFVRVTINP